MFVKISKPPVGDNKGSCVKLANYLEKEGGTFFSHNETQMSYGSAVYSIDSNNKQLGLKEDKFYMITINPSQDELKYLLGENINSYEDLSPKDIESLNQKMMDYTRDVMDSYAANFGRENVSDGNDLAYFAKIEYFREYKFYDKEVKAGERKVGELKEGFQTHIHVVVSRKSKDGKARLSPNAKSRGDTTKLQGREVKRGFNHLDFKVDSINKFNARFNYTSNYNSHVRLNNKAQKFTK